ncbi:APPLE domain-containing protein [Durusdinium trenchii]
MFYNDPVKMEGSERTVELSAEACQQRCQVVEDCAHFTFWPDGGCLLTSEESSVKAAPYKYSATVSGPKYCGVPPADDDDDDVDTASSEAQQGESTWGAGESAVKEVVPPGINGTSCSKYPACVAVGISDGDCCPNADAVKLGCCEGFPKAVEEVKIAAGAECSRFPACVSLNISGACCPTPDGINLGCCESV